MPSPRPLPAASASSPPPSAAAVRAHQSPASPTASLVRHTLDSASALQQTLDRRKTFRCRGSLGPTVASAPSVELPYYRTPSPRIGKSGGKSFDLGGEAVAGCSDNNGLVKVSADFLRLHGSRQQFRSLLGRKKLGQLPPAYSAQIDCSYESSFDSNNTGPFGRGASVAHPLIKVEEAGGGDEQRRPLAKTSAAGQSAVIWLGDSRQSLAEKPAENGGPPQQFQAVLVGNGGGGSGLCPPPSPGPHPPHSGAVCFKRNSSRYGTPIDGSAVKMVYKIRSQRLSDRVRITDRCLLLAMLGIFLMVLDSELCGQHFFGIDKYHLVSLLLRSLVLLSTIFLLIEIVHFHLNELNLDLVDCGADDWRVVLSWRRCWQFCIEFLLCSIIPLPFTGTIKWSFVESSRSWSIGGGESARNVYREERDVPLDTILSLLMLGRLYLVGRWQVLHSKQFQDASTRTLAALNRIQVNFGFVLKTVLDQRPMVFLSIFLLIFWLITAWSFAQVERPYTFGLGGDDAFILYTNALWFIAITFNGNGYGDIVPRSLAGRCIAILVGISGAVISSILIAVISRKILLSQGQRNVNSFMNDASLTLAHKNAAARVLQKTWLIHRCLRSSDVSDHLLRRQQRKFLGAIYQFRRIKNKMRSLGENSSASLQQLNRLMTEMHANTQRLALAQEEIRLQLEILQNQMRGHFEGQQEQRGTATEAERPQQQPQSPPSLAATTEQSPPVSAFYPRRQ